MAASSYKRITQLLHQWPIDKNKAGRDLGQFLRDQIERALKEGKFEGNQQSWDKKYLAVQRLINDEHVTKHKRTLSSSATGLSAEECNAALSPEVLKSLEEDTNTGVFRKLFSLKAK